MSGIGRDGARSAARVGLLMGIAGAALLEAAPAAAATAEDPQPGTAVGEVVVTAAPKTYVAKQSTTATKTDTPVIETPQSITVITADQIEAQDVQTVGQALRYAAGVQAEPFGFDARFDQFLVRGFAESVVGKYRDGLRQLNGSFSHFQDEPYGLERIEILRGPASVLYGSNQPGGVVNTITKRPLDKAFGEVEGQAGNYDRYQGQFDMGGPLLPGGALDYRLTGLARDSGTQTPFGKDDRLYIAPAVTWRPDADTSLTLLADWERNRGEMWPYFLKLPTGLTHIALTDPEYDGLHQEQWSLAYLFERRLSDGLTLRQNLRYGQINFLGQFVDALSLAANGRTLNRYAGKFVDRDRSLTVDTQLEAKFATGPLTHTALMGVEYDDLFTSLRFQQALGPPLDLIQPVYSLSPVGPLQLALSQATKTEQTGVYAQDQAKLDRLVLTAGVRYDWADTRTRNRASGGLTQQSDSQVSGRVGAVYLLPAGFAPYVSYSTSFLPNPGATFAGTTFKPTTGDQVEAGLKYEPPGLNATATLSVFDIHEDDVLTADPAHTLFQVQTGRVRSRGAELSGVADLGSGFNITANYSYTDTKVLRSNGADLGKAFAAVPNNQVAVWFDYVRPQGVLRGLGGGAGLRYTDETPQDAANTSFNPEYTVVDAAIHYDWSRYRVALNVTNLGDTRKPYCNSGTCTFTQGRVVLGSLRYRW